MIVYRAVETGYFQPIRGELHGGAIIASHVGLGGGQEGGQRQQEVGRDADVQLLPRVDRHLPVKRRGEHARVEDPLTSDPVTL